MRVSDRAESSNLIIYKQHEDNESPQQFTQSASSVGGAVYSVTWTACGWKRDITKLQLVCFARFLEFQHYF